VRISHLLSYASDSNASGIVLMDELSKSCLVLDEAECYFLLSAELWKPDNSFDGINVVSNDN
jgi:hypothetical protein